MTETKTDELLEELPWTVEDVFDLMSELGISDIRISYSGGGDSGGYDSPTAFFNNKPANYADSNAYNITDSFAEVQSNSDNDMRIYNLFLPFWNGIRESLVDFLVAPIDDKYTSYDGEPMVEGRLMWDADTRKVYFDGVESFSESHAVDDIVYEDACSSRSEVVTQLQTQQIEDTTVEEAAELATAYHHALSSVKRWGGNVEDYLPIHNWFDASKEFVGDFRHRALRHHSQGIFEAERVFGTTLKLSNGNVITVRQVGEQHVTEDCGFIPCLSDWFRHITVQNWMTKGFKVDTEEQEKAALKDVK